MTHRELAVGQHYIGRVSGRLVPVRLDEIFEVQSAGKMVWRYRVTNIATGRKIVFASCQKFRMLASQATVNNCKEGAVA